MDNKRNFAAFPVEEEPDIGVDKLKEMVETNSRQVKTRRGEMSKETLEELVEGGYSVASDVSDNKAELVYDYPPDDRDSFVLEFDRDDIEVLNTALTNTLLDLERRIADTPTTWRTGRRNMFARKRVVTNLLLRLRDVTDAARRS